MVKISKLNVKSVSVEGSGAIILTGPSGCGKGEIAKYLVNMLQLDEKFHLSMGNILRNIIDKAKKDFNFMEKLATQYGISNEISIFDENYNEKGVIEKVESYKNEITEIIQNKDKKNKDIVTQFEWLCYAVENGLLVPKNWTNKILEATFENNEEIRNSIFLLDGYPRTIYAARHMLDLYEKLNISIIKVIHLSITKNEMIRRAKLRNRFDDNEKALENRFHFYIEQVQPSVDEIKNILGSDCVALIDAHQPEFYENGEINVIKSIKNVANDVVTSLGISF